MHQNQKTGFVVLSMLFLMLIQSDLVNTDIEGSVESVRINEVSVLSGLNLEKMKGVFFPRDKANCP